MSPSIRRRFLRCGSSINGRRLVRVDAKINSGAGGASNDEEEAKDEIDLTQELTDQEEVTPWTREWILEHHGPNEAEQVALLPVSSSYPT